MAADRRRERGGIDGEARVVMATTIEGRIARALLERANAVGLGLPVALPNMPFDPPDDQRYLEVTHIPTATQRQWIDSDGVHRYIGMLQVSVYWSHGRGEIEPRDIAGKVIEAFPCDTILVEDDVTVRITKRPEAAGIITEDYSVQIPVTIEYEAYE